MMLPTKDKDLEREVLAIICSPSIPPAMKATLILDVAESNGYHKGLPESIEHALNSGDGSYRP